MLVSYVIPVYNMENYIQQCINSIFFQIMIGTDDEIEIIIVNDGSTDNSMEKICDTIEDHFNKPFWKSVTGFTIIDFKQNQGAGNALFEGFKAANGDYICYLSADDGLNDVMKTHNQMYQMLIYNEIYDGADLSYCNKWYIGHSNNLCANIVKSSFIFSYDIFNKIILSDNYLTYFFLNFKNPINSSTFMFTRSAIEKYGNWDPNVKSDCDGELLLRYAVYGAKIREIEFIKPAIFYRLHDNQLSNNINYMTETMKYNRIKYKNIVLNGKYPLWLKLLVKLFVRG